MFDVKTVSMEWGGKTLTLETGRIARQADGAVLATYGETVVLCAVTAAKSVKEGQDFFPLTVHYQEKFSAAGRIPGGFFKRERGATEKETLTSRLIDRPIRPLFPEGFYNEINVIAQVFSYDGECEPDVLAMIAASAALTISGVPFMGPIGAARVGYIDGNLSASEHIAFERHMASCSVCRTIERELRMTQTLLRTLPSVEPRQDFEARLAARIADVKLKPSPWWMRVWLPSYVKPARRRHVAIPVVAVASVVASLGFVYVSRVPTVKAGAVQTAAASDETAVLSELANQHHAASATQSLGDTSGVVVVASDMATGGSW